MRTPAGAALVLLALTATLVAPSGAQPPPTWFPHHRVEVTRIEGPDRITTAARVSAHAFPDAHTVVLARSDTWADALVAGPLAARLDAPVLLTEFDRLADVVADEIQRLGAVRAILVGALGAAVSETLNAAGLYVDHIAGSDAYASARLVADRLGPSDHVWVASGERFPDALAAGAAAARATQPLLLVGRDHLPQDTADALSALAPRQVTLVGGPSVISDAVMEAIAAGPWTVERLTGRDRYEVASLVHERATHQERASEVWLVTGETWADALGAGPAAAHVGASLLPVSGAWLDRAPGPARRLRALAGGLQRVVVVGGPGAVTPHVAAQLDGLLYGPDLPGGDRRLLHDNRIVAFYGHHSTPLLGALGEQPPDQVGGRLGPLADSFTTAQRRVIYGFDLIATTAIREPGSNGVYAEPAGPEELQPWLDAADRLDAYVVLDIQPGRSDFLTEVRRYEHLLLRPDIGVGLDPEWRVGPTSTPGGGQVGFITAAELNAVQAYLSQLVTTRGLPEKLLVVHQFKESMIRDRQAIARYDGVALVASFDGWGEAASKISTYQRLALPSPHHNGFMPFFDEDRPLLSPGQILSLDPQPGFVVYQ